MIARLLALVKFSHTLFALPFAAIMLLWLWPPSDSLWDLLWLLLAMVGARTAAMGFNRLVDRRLDAVNPRTQNREIPAGTVSLGQAHALIWTSVAVFLGAAGLLNVWCLVLAPVALVVILGYSYTKRVTWLCHWVLGLGIGLAPVGVELGLTEGVSWVSVLLGVGIMFWISGFDIIYSLLDRDFDKAQRLHSVPVRFGPHGALWLSRFNYGITLAAWTAAGLLVEASFAWWLGLATVGVILVLEHVQAASLKPDALNRAFFSMNTAVSVVLLLAALPDVF